MRTLLYALVRLSLIGVVLAETTDYCEHYANCLDHLENKQRECLKLPESESTRDSQLLECQKRKRRKLQVELAGLQLRKTELVGDCISEHMDRAESVLDESKEKKCQSAADKMAIIDEVLLNPKSLGSKQSKKRRQNKQVVRFCRRSKKMLMRKCRQLSKCCSLSSECELQASYVSDQILSLKEELRREINSNNETCTV